LGLPFTSGEQTSRLFKAFHILPRRHGRPRVSFRAIPALKSSANLSRRSLKSTFFFFFFFFSFFFFLFWFCFFFFFFNYSLGNTPVVHNLLPARNDVSHVKFWACPHLRFHPWFFFFFAAKRLPFLFPSLVARHRPSFLESVIDQVDGKDLFSLPPPSLLTSFALGASLAQSRS